MRSHTCTSGNFLAKLRSDGQNKGMPVKDEEFIPTRTSLLGRLKNWEDQESWQEFFDTYWKMLYSVARRAGLNESDAQDVVQETIVAVAKKMPEFKYDPAIGSFKSWLMLIIRRRIIDFFRKRGRHVQPPSSRGGSGPRQARHEAPSATGTGTLARLPDPDGDQIHRIY